MSVGDYPKPGEQIDHYKLLSYLGAGGMGVLFLAADVKTFDRQVALKVLNPDLSANEVFIERFILEARAAARLSHPNIVTVHAFGQSSGLHYIAMEYVEGLTLRKAFEGVGRKMPPVIALSIIRGIASGLEHAHEHKLVHRDIKPSNVLISRSGVVKLVDFGLVRDVSQTRGAGTIVGDVLGTSSYMSPEQAAGESVDTRTDIFSLGVVAYEVLSGARPFPGQDVEVRRKIIEEGHQTLRLAFDEVSPGLNALIEGLLKKSREDRIQSIREVVRSVERCLREYAPGGVLEASQERDYLQLLVSDPGAMQARLSEGFSERAKRVAGGATDRDELEAALRELKRAELLVDDRSGIRTEIKDLERRIKETRAATDEEDDATRAVIDGSFEVAAMKTQILPEGAGKAPEVTKISPVPEPVPVMPRTDRFPRHRIGELLRDAGKRSRQLAFGATGVIVLAAGLIAFSGRPQSGWIALVTSRPSGASIFVEIAEDGTFESLEKKTPAWLDVRDGDEIIVQLVKEGSATVRQVIRRQEEAGVVTYAHVELSATDEVGEVRVDSEPSGARVTLHRTETGNVTEWGEPTPTVVTNLADGNWVVSLQLEGYREWRQGITVGPVAAPPVAAQLEPIPGRISIASAKPADANVVMKRRDEETYRPLSSKVPCESGDLRAGRYDLKISVADRPVWNGSVDVANGKTTQIAPLDSLFQSGALTVSVQGDGSSGSPVESDAVATQDAPRSNSVLCVQLTVPGSISVGSHVIARDTERTCCEVTSGEPHVVRVRWPNLVGYWTDTVTVEPSDTVVVRSGHRRTGRVDVTMSGNDGGAWDLSLGEDGGLSAPGTMRVVAGEYRLSVRRAGWRVVSAVCGEGKDQRVSSPSASEDWKGIDVEIENGRTTDVRLIVERIG